MDGNNVPLGAIERIPGHRNRSTTEIYLHSLEQTSAMLSLFINGPGILTQTSKKKAKPKILAWPNPFKSLVPGTRIELVRRLSSKGF